MNTRARILARVAAARQDDGGMEAVEQHIRRHPRGALPAKNKPTVENFCDRAIRLASDLVRATDETEVPGLVAQYLQTHDLPRHAVCWPSLLTLPWSTAGIEVTTRATEDADSTGITGTFAAIAETGTLMLLSEKDTPATVSLLPETHIAIVHTHQVVDTMEDGWDRLRQHGSMPRAVNFISGPSRTGDIEQNITLGAHGPRRVLIIVVG